MSRSCPHREPAARPLSHFAASSAPCANTARSRTVCVSVTVSAGASNPTVCVPGIEPARVDETSIGRVIAGAVPSPLAASAPCPTARPSWRCGAARGSRRRRPVDAANRRAASSTTATEHRACRSRNSPTRARRCRPRSAIARHAAFVGLPAGRADHDVRCRASANCAEIRDHGAGRARSRWRRPRAPKSASRDRSRRRRARSRRRRPRSRAPARSCSTSRPMRPWPISRRRLRSLAGDSRDLKNRSCTRASAGSRSRFADHERDVPARRRLRHHPNRHAADGLEQVADERRIVLQAVADARR